MNPDGAEHIPPGYLGVSPQTSSPPEKGQRQWVDRFDQLVQVVDILAQADIIAIDTEFTQVFSRTSSHGDTPSPTHRIALLQLAIASKCFVVDTLRLNDLSPLHRVVENPATAFLFHGAGADLHVMAERGLNVAHYYDLEAASRSIFGQNESSLASMLRRALGFRLDKSLQRTDWTRRPLPPAMVAYAARDAEMTLALYSWLAQHFPWALQLHEHTLNEPVRAAAWILPFLQGSTSVPAEVVVAQAKKHAQLDDATILADCRSTLLTLRQSLYRSRLLRLITDLQLVALLPEISMLLTGQASDERAACLRSLGRLGNWQDESLKERIHPLLSDPVFDVRKAAQTALRNLSAPKQPSQTIPSSKLSDGTRGWTIGEAEPTNTTADANDWKARLRSLMGDDSDQ